MEFYQTKNDKNNSKIINYKFNKYKYLRVPDFDVKPKKGDSINGCKIY